LTPGSNKVPGVRVTIIGAGIVGSALARELAAVTGVEVTVLEAAAGSDSLRGSTGYAPGIVGLYNDAPAMTALARASADVYDTFPHAFRRAGGVEVATTDAGVAELARRADGARSAGLGAVEASAEGVMRLAPHVVDTDRMVAAWAYPDDGVAYTRLLIQAIRAEARARGASFIDGATVAAIEPNKEGGLLVTAEGERQFPADAVALCGGVWAPSLGALVGAELPLVPVAHPYVYSAPREELQSGSFVRWPEHHVYARVHGDRLGIGTYDHVPLPVAQSDLADGAGLAWAEEAFDQAIAKAEELLPSASRFEPDEQVNAVFAVTPDNLPLLGPVGQLPGVWSAQGIWVTHAAGAAQALAAAITDGEPLPPEMNPARFAARDAEELRSSALRLYHDIYASDVFPGHTPIGESSRNSCSS
jgi:glycine/D-amino acid oxidase-like deaminating enzyme